MERGYEEKYIEAKMFKQPFFCFPAYLRQENM